MRALLRRGVHGLLTIAAACDLKSEARECVARGMAAASVRERLQQLAAQSDGMPAQELAAKLLELSSACLSQSRGPGAGATHAAGATAGTSGVGHLAQPAVQHVSTHATRRLCLQGSKRRRPRPSPPQRPPQRPKRLGKSRRGPLSARRHAKVRTGRQRHQAPAAGHQVWPTLMQHVGVAPPTLDGRSAQGV